MDAFTKFDRDASGEIDTQELFTVLVYLGFTTSLEKAAAVGEDVDADGSGTVNKHEFLMCMRKVREQEIKHIASRSAEADLDKSGTIGLKEFKILLQSLGYFPDMSCVAEAAEDAGINLKDSAQLDLDMLWRLLQVYRFREGLSRDDYKGLNEAFKLYSDEHHDASDIKVEMLGQALRYMGYPLPFVKQNLMLHMVDSDGSGQLNIVEFRKLIRMCREREIEQFKRVFREADVSTRQCLTEEQALEAFRTMGCVDERGEPPVITISSIANYFAPVDMLGFIQTGLRQSAANRAHFRTKSNHLFSFAERVVLKERFAFFDADGSGDISRNELIRLIDQIFPEMARDRAMRPRLLNIMEEVDADGNGQLEFQDFLRLFRLCNDMQDVERYKKLLQAKDETSFTPQEIQEFRKLFIATDMDASQEISLQEFKKMIATVCPMGNRNSEQFNQMFHRITARQCFVEGQRDCADFPEFLWLMKELLDTNFGGIKESTGGKLPGVKSSAK